MLLNKAGPPKHRQQLSQVGFRNILASGDLRILDWPPFPVMQGQFDQGPDAVVSLRRDLHLIDSRLV